jgi:tetratricopeptide (TPR) repeat protein
MRLYFIPLAFIFLFLNLSCDTRQENEFERGLKYQSKSDFQLALSEFDRTMKREPGNLVSLRAARESLKILLYEIKNYEKAIDVLKFLILYSNSPEERWKAQSQISQIYFDNLAWYDKALVEYSKLLSGHLPKEENLRVRLAIARCYYYLGQFAQSWSEASNILVEHDISEDQAFDVYLLQANIHQSLKKFPEAAKELERILIRFPERAKKENIGINLALCYEELGVHKEALRVLESLKEYYKPKEYIELRIKKIKYRLLNQPKKRIKK